MFCAAYVVASNWLVIKPITLVFPLGVASPNVFEVVCFIFLLYFQPVGTVFFCLNILVAGAADVVHVVSLSTFALHLHNYGSLYNCI